MPSTPGEPLLAITLAYAWFRLSGSTTCSISRDVKARRRAIAADGSGSTTGPDPVAPSPAPSWRGDDPSGDDPSVRLVCCLPSIELIRDCACVERFGPWSATSARRRRQGKRPRRVSWFLGLLRPLLTSAAGYDAFRRRRS